MRRVPLAPEHVDTWLERITLKTQGTQQRISTRALFIIIGAAPNTGWLSGLAATDAKGFVLTGAGAGQADDYATTAPRSFAVGDVRAGSVKREASAVGEGSERSHSIARDFLAPVAANPHGGGAAAQAKRLLALIADVADNEAVDIRNLPKLVETPEVTASGD